MFVIFFIVCLINAAVYAMDNKPGLQLDMKFSPKKYMEEFDDDLDDFEDSQELRGKGRILHTQSLSPNNNKSNSSRLETAISEDRVQEEKTEHSDWDSEDDEYALEMQRNMEHRSEILSYAESGKLLNYLIQDLESQKDKIRNIEFFTQTMVTYAEKLNSVQSTIEGAVAHILCFFYETGRRYCSGKEDFYTKDTIFQTFKAELKLLVQSQRELVHNACKGSHEDIPLVTSIFKFYAKELFEKLIKTSSDQHIYLQFYPDKPKERGKQEKAVSTTPKFETLYAWKVTQEMVMTIFKAFLNDFNKSNYGGYNDTMTKKLREVATLELKKYFAINLHFLAERYGKDRGNLTKLLSYTGVKGSSTKEHFHWFADKFEAKFTDKAFPNLDVNATKKDYLKKFEEDDLAFSKTVSETASYINPFGWSWGKLL